MPVPFPYSFLSQGSWLSNDRVASWFAGNSSAVLQRHHDRLDLGIQIEDLAALFAPPAGLPKTAKRQSGIDRAVHIHANRAGPDLADHLMGDTEIARPHASRQPVHGPVGFLGDAIEIIVIKSHCTKNRAENLFADDRHFRPGVGQDRWFNEIAFVTDAIAAGHHGGAVIFSLLNVAGHPLELLLGYKRPHLRAIAQPVTDADFFCLGRNAGDDLIEDARVGVEPRSGGADLAGICKDRARRSGNCDIHVGIGKDDHRRLAAQFKRYFLQVAAGGLNDEPADLAGAGERDLVDVGMGGDGGACRWTKAGHDVDDPSGIPASWIS